MEQVGRTACTALTALYWMALKAKKVKVPKALTDMETTPGEQHNSKTHDQASPIKSISTERVACPEGVHPDR